MSAKTAGGGDEQSLEETREEVKEEPGGEECPQVEERWVKKLWSK